MLRISARKAPISAPAPFPGSASFRRLAFKKHLAIRRTLDLAAAEERQTLSFKFGISKIGDAPAQRIDFREQRAIRNIATRRLAPIANVADHDEGLAQIGF